MTNGNKFAFAMLDPNSGFSQYGLTKRELFAAMAMQGFLSEGCINMSTPIADCAVQLADALIAELNKNTD